MNAEEESSQVMLNAPCLIPFHRKLIVSLRAVKYA